VQEAALPLEQIAAVSETGAVDAASAAEQRLEQPDPAAVPDVVQHLPHFRPS